MLWNIYVGSEKVNYDPYISWDAADNAAMSLIAAGFTAVSVEPDLIRWALGRCR